MAGELVVLDHLEIMAANGFDFDVDDTAPAGTFDAELGSSSTCHSLAIRTSIYHCILARGCYALQVGGCGSRLSR